MLTFERKTNVTNFPPEIQEEINRKVREYAKDLYDNLGGSGNTFFLGRYSINNYRQNLEESYAQQFQAPPPPLTGNVNFYPYHTMMYNGWNYI